MSNLLEEWLLESERIPIYALKCDAICDEDPVQINSLASAKSDGPTVRAEQVDKALQALKSRKEELRKDLTVKCRISISI